MPPPDTTAPPAPTPGYDPYASPPQPGYAVQPQPKKKKSLWWIALIVAGAATITVVAIVLAVYFTPATPIYERSPALISAGPGGANRVDRHDVGVTLFRF
jgi:hypothetical protein